MSDRKWPYPARVDQTCRMDADVLVLGGGIAGCMAAISAARRGAKVVLVDKGAARRSGAGGQRLRPLGVRRHQSLFRRDARGAGPGHAGRQRRL